MGILDALQWLGESVDKPGAAVRGLAGGQGVSALANLIPFSDTLGVTDPGDRIYGRDLLERWGMLGENTPGLDIGDVAGFGVDLLTDPLNWLGGLGASRLLKARRPNIPVSVASELDEGYAVARAIGKQDELGSVTLMPPRPGESGAAARGWPDIVPQGAKVSRVEGSMLDDALQGRGIGQQMYLDAMQTSPAEWFYNSGNSDAATRAIEALRKKGLADVHWQRSLGGPRVMRLTDQGRSMAGTGGLIHPPRNPSLSPILAGLLSQNTLAPVGRYQ